MEPESQVSKHQSSSAATPASGPAADGCCAVFQALLAGGLRAAAVGAHQDAGEDDVAAGGAESARAEDWLTRMAALGRLAPDRTLPMLHTQLQQHQQVSQMDNPTERGVENLMICEGIAYPMMSYCAPCVYCCCC